MLVPALAALTAVVAAGDLSWLSALGGWATLTPSGLLIIVVVMILAGLLIPRFVYLQKEKEVLYLRAANEKLRDIADEAVKTQVAIAKSLKSIERALYSIAGPAVLDGGEDDDEVAAPTLER